MQQTVLKEHNLDPAIKSNLDPVAMPSMLPTPSVLNLDSTSNPKSIFNISVDTIEPNTKATKLTNTVSDKEVSEPTEVIKPTVAAIAPTDNVFKDEEATLDQLFDRAYEKDPILNKVLELLAKGVNYSKDLTIADCSIVNERLHYKGLLYVSDYHAIQMHLCKTHHDTLVAGHLGIGNTYELLHCHYYWPNMQSFVHKYVRHCHVCKQSKGSRFKKQGVLQPLPVPQQRWQDISIDLVTGIPEVQGCDTILTVVDRLSKKRHYIGTTKELNAEGLAGLFLKHVWKHHGLPQSIVSDRGSQFISDF